MITITPYSPEHEKAWVYTKALAYLFSDFFDDNSRAKDTFPSDIYEDTIELVALDGDQVVGLLDIAIYNKNYSQSYKYHPADKVAYFTNLAVHPDHQGKGIAGRLFEKAECLLREKGVKALAIFTRGDENANHLYQKWGGKLVSTDYLVVGTPKSEPADFTFQVNLAEQRLAFVKSDGTEQPYYLREGVYVVAQKEDLELFDCEQVYEERTYIKTYD